ncbi:MAG: hypothetical protein JZU63_10255 [Rhodoferax sp.]|nr:hypothetical protein [Rhodoferax sp.]
MALFIGVAMLYAYEIGNKKATPATTVVAATNSVRAMAAISNAVLRVRVDIASATNTEDIAALRIIEHRLTNSLWTP